MRLFPNKRNATRLERRHIPIIRFPLYFLEQRSASVNTEDMHSLEKELRELSVYPPTRRNNKSNSAETSDGNTAATTFLSHLDHFIRDLDERKGKLSCCQEVIEIQTSVERFLKTLLEKVEKDHPFYKTTLIKSGSFYEGTKVGKPDEFDYFVQLDNFSQPEDILFEELAHSVVTVIPSESAFEKLLNVNRNLCSFDWKDKIKKPFFRALHSKLASGFEAFNLQVLSQTTRRHGPAYTLHLKWTGGKLYKGLNIAVDLVLAVKINVLSSTMEVDLESQAGSVVSSLLHTLPYYFAISGYKERTFSSSNLFKEAQKRREEGLGFPISITDQSDCLLRISQSCLEQSLFRDHFGPDGGPSVCLRVLKVLRDMTRTFDEHCHLHAGLLFPGPCHLCESTFDKSKSVDQNVREFINNDKKISSNGHMNVISLFSDKEPAEFISSYTLKTLVLFEWSENPEDEQWTGRNLTQRIVNIVTVLLDFLKQNEGIRSFWYKDYHVLSVTMKYRDVLLSDAIDRVAIIFKSLSSLRTAGQYCFEDCVQTLTNWLELARRKTKLTRFLHSALEDIFCVKIREVVKESVCKSKKKEGPPTPEGPEWMSVIFVEVASIFCDIYIQALLEKLAPEEEFQVFGSYLNRKNNTIFVSGTGDWFTREEAAEIVKNAREIFDENGLERMTDDLDLADYSLWSRNFKYNEVVNLIKILCENFEKDIEIMRNKITALKESREAGNGE